MEDFFQAKLTEIKEQVSYANINKIVELVLPVGLEPTIFDQAQVPFVVGQGSQLSTANFHSLLLLAVYPS